MKGFQDKKILVSGGEGFLGGRVILRLLGLGADVTAVRIDGGGSQEGEIPAGCPVLDMGCLENSEFSGMPEAILFLNHPEILPNDRVGESFLNIQLSGLNKLLRLAGRFSSYFVYASSAAVYGKQKYLPIDEEHPLEPIMMYGAAKLAGEYFCRASALEKGFSYIILRLGDLYGPGSRDVGAPADLLGRALRNEPLVVKGNGGQVSTYVYIEDAADAVISALSGKKPNQTVNVAGNEFVSVWHLANIIKKKFSLKSEIKTSHNTLLDEIECCVDSGKAEELIGFKPSFNLTAGLSLTCRWLSETRERLKDS